ncbi:hypothetical protein SAMD00019534_120640 [Acytostelium subglobosum LB1]|uniref:hypothetical protein n=1 Tax=Acytostelium subglobosum LB1 TaxID=1410327 RepID=UPI000644AC6D|nr:hypothetical protein SAMD00019534_120640 [Acytostelium subglobosum LB1]GAM28888.1 hypothetical protein SAMD00019534_120640 [Acytostelium subglobosum LB1]|eukprot:XP_012748073.1 hypothetical protein SAMD00019534_120640 [Acytostelium subglobosum LB1]
MGRKKSSPAQKEKITNYFNRIDQVIENDDNDFVSSSPPVVVLKKQINTSSSGIGGKGSKSSISSSGSSKSSTSSSMLIKRKKMQPDDIFSDDDDSSNTTPQVIQRIDTDDDKENKFELVDDAVKQERKRLKRNVNTDSNNNHNNKVLSPTKKKTTTTSTSSTPSSTSPSPHKNKSSSSSSTPSSNKHKEVRSPLVMESRPKPPPPSSNKLSDDADDEITSPDESISVSRSHKRDSTPSSTNNNNNKVDQPSTPKKESTSHSTSNGTTNGKSTPSKQQQHRPAVVQSPKLEIKRSGSGSKFDFDDVLDDDEIVSSPVIKPNKNYNTNYVSPLKQSDHTASSSKKTTVPAASPKKQLTFASYDPNPDTSITAKPTTIKPNSNYKIKPTIKHEEKEDEIDEVDDVVRTPDTAVKKEKEKMKPVDKQEKVVEKKKAQPVVKDEEEEAAQPSKPRVSTLFRSTSTLHPADDSDDTEKESEDVAKKTPPKPTAKPIAKTTSKTTPKKKTGTAAAAATTTDEEKAKALAKRDNFLKYKMNAAQGPPPPPNKGSKPYPKGTPTCLRNKTFLVTGVMDSFERDEMNDIIQKFGGKLLKTVSGKLNYLIVGIEPGVSKLEKAKRAKAKLISEDELLEMVNSSIKQDEKVDEDEEETGVEDEIEESAGEEDKAKNKTTACKSVGKVKVEEKEEDVVMDEENEDVQMEDVKTEQNEGDEKEKEKKVETVSTQSTTTTTTTTSNNNISQSLDLKPKTLSLLRNTSSLLKPQLSLKPTLSLNINGFKPASSLKLTLNNNNNNYANSAESKKDFDYLKKDMSRVVVPSSFKKLPPGNDMMWVDKYKPASSADLLGNPGVISTLKSWLVKWDPKMITQRAALLSGPPGIGKTSSALMLCKEAGYEPLELNASDTRNKTQIEKLLSGVSDNHSITEFFSNKKKGESKKTVIIMDEIDGSSGNDDRGGVSEILLMIKTTKIPFICICNDYYSPKIKTLKNYCLDLKFRRPSVMMVSDRLLQIAKHEGLVMNEYMIEKIFSSTNQDIRQSIHMMQMLSRSNVKATHNDINVHIANANKDMDIGPFSGAQHLLSVDSSNPSINDKLDYFFTDFSLVPLLIQENYLYNKPYNRASNRDDDDDEITRFANAAECISDGDLLNKDIIYKQNFNLLPAYGIISSVIPSSYVNGGSRMPLNFPQYLGKNSNANKQLRFIREIQLHTRVSGARTLTNCNETRMSLAPMLRHYLIQPLVLYGQDGIEDVIDMMDTYGLTEDDRNNNCELVHGVETT